LFLDLDPARWWQLNHNPVALLGEMPLAGIERRARELVLHGRINYTYRRQQEYLQADRTGAQRTLEFCGRAPVAYFSAEFGLHESIRSIPAIGCPPAIILGASDLDIHLSASVCFTARIFPPTA
jgi:hypothetical protein